MIEPLKKGKRNCLKIVISLPMEVCECCECYYWGEDLALLKKNKNYRNTKQKRAMEVEAINDVVHDNTNIYNTYKIRNENE